MSRYRPRFTTADREILGDELAWDGFFRVRRLTLRHRLFAGEWSAVMERELFERGNAVGVLLYDPVLETVVLVEQFRVGAVADAESPWLLELVAGLIDSDESDEQVARRESAEEAGLVVTDLIRIGRYYSSPGGSSEQFTAYCGRVSAAGAGGVFGLAGEHEDIRVHCIPWADIPALLAEGAVRNVHTIAVLQWLLLNHDAVHAQWQA